MTLSDIANQRLHNQWLLSRHDDPLAVLAHFGAMQAQDYKAAKWALGLRSNATDAQLDQLFNEGKIVRIHMLRPTWHFVLPEDVQWILALTGERVLTTLNHYYRKLEFDEIRLQHVTAALTQRLAGGVLLTQAELREFYASQGFQTTTMHISFLLIYARMKGLICSGPMRGKQHTVMLMSERVKGGKKLQGDEALAELTRRFFTAHGPATIQDFAWWSSLLTSDIRRGIALAELESMEVEGKMFYYASKSSTAIPGVRAHLLPNFDEYTVAYKERRPFIKDDVRAKLLYQPQLPHQIIVNGQLVGSWRWKPQKTATAVTLEYFDELTAPQKRAVHDSAKELGAFLGMPVTISE